MRATQCYQLQQAIRWGGGGSQGWNVGVQGDTRGVQMSTMGAQGGRVRRQQGTQRAEHMDTREQKGLQMSTRGYTGCKRGTGVQEGAQLFIHNREK